MTPQEHKKQHENLHRSLDELVADFIAHTEKLPSKTSVMELLTWSFQQTQNPTEGKHK